MCTGPKVLVTPQQPRSRCAARDVSGDHVLNKRESRPERRSHSVSYGAWPRGSRTVLLARSGEPRVPASLWSPSCCVQLRVHTSQWRRDVEGGPRPCHGARDEVAGGDEGGEGSGSRKVAEEEEEEVEGGRKVCNENE